MSWLPAWKSLTPAPLRSAVLDWNNRFRLYVAIRTAAYLKDIPATDFGIECSRAGNVKMNRRAEEMSELLRLTRNWAPPGQELPR